MHGPEEVALANDLFDRVEDLLGLPRHTVKMGVMDEERRTSANLAACIAAARHRIVFINTGFLDRTGDEIHTVHGSRAGAAEGSGQDAALDPRLREAQRADRPCDGLLRPRADRQGHVGDARPHGRHAQDQDRASAGRRQHGMGALAHGRGAACAALSPGRRRAPCRRGWQAEPTPGTDDLLTPPLATIAADAGEVQRELDNNIQGILGYVVRWIDQGVGCSKVPGHP